MVQGIQSSEHARKGGGGGGGRGDLKGKGSASLPRGSSVYLSILVNQAAMLVLVSVLRTEELSFFFMRFTPKRERSPRVYLLCQGAKTKATTRREHVCLARCTV